MGLFSGIYEWATGGDTSDAYEASRNILEERKKNIKGAQQIMNESRAAAGQAAADKAGEAKKAATGAARMANASKLTAATQGAAAASKAASEGYQEAANQAANIEASKEQQLTNIAGEQAKSITDEAEGKAKRRQAQNTATMSAVASVLSDGSCKNKKHSYIPVEKR